MNDVQIHMKLCAKQRGISTAQLLDMVHDRKKPGLSLDTKKSRQQTDLRSLFRRTSESDSDFKTQPQTQQTMKKRGKRPAAEKLEYVKI